jgi:hypothetical protein
VGLRRKAEKEGEEKYWPERGDGGCWGMGMQMVRLLKKNGETIAKGRIGYPQ